MRRPGVIFQADRHPHVARSSHHPSGPLLSLMFWPHSRQQLSRFLWQQEGPDSHCRAFALAVPSAGTLFPADSLVWLLRAFRSLLLHPFPVNLHCPPHPCDTRHLAFLTSQHSSSCAVGFASPSVRVLTELWPSPLWQAGGQIPGVLHRISLEENQSQEQNAEFLGGNPSRFCKLRRPPGAPGCLCALVRSPSELSQDEPGRGEDPALNSRYHPGSYPPSTSDPAAGPS